MLLFSHGISHERVLYCILFRAQRKDTVYIAGACIRIYYCDLSNELTKSTLLQYGDMAERFEKNKNEHH